MMVTMQQMVETYRKIKGVLSDPKMMDALAENDKKSLLEWLENVRYVWELNARKEQKIPPGEWSTWLVLAGRGWGKTKVGAESVRQLVRDNGYRAVGLIGPTAADARDTMIEGKGGSSLIEVSHPDEGVQYFPTKRRIEWGNGAQGSAFSAEEPERLRGPQHDLLWCLSAGTMVLMADGLERPIEDVSPGDMVQGLTGPREVLVSASRLADLWEVGLADGSRLEGSGDHPVLTERGWVQIRHLTRDDRIYPWVETGAKTSKGTSTATSQVQSFTDTESFTRRGLVLSQGGGTSTTGMGSRATTGPRTLSPSAPRSTRGNTRSNESRRGASFAETSSRALETQSTVTLAGPGRTSQPEGLLPHGASTVARLSELGVEPIAVSAVSTLGRVGRVYNLEVDVDHVFVANGLLTHNCDELAAWRYLDETWDMAMFGLRLGKNPRNIITSTPKPLPKIRELVADAVPASEMEEGMVVETVVTRGATMDNRDNLAPQFLEVLMRKYEGTRLGRQELYAEILDDNPNALFQQVNIDRSRVDLVRGKLRTKGEISLEYREPQGAERPQRFKTVFEELVIAVDPSMSADIDSDETGIVVMARDRDMHLYVLEDASGIYSPNDWAMVVVRLYEKYGADAVVAEVNQGGDLVENTIRTVEKEISSGRLNYKKVRASRGKVSRAEPVGALEEQGRIHHVDDLPKLEEQLVTFTPGYQRSPDRLDAYVWGAHHLVVQHEKEGFFIA